MIQENVNQYLYRLYVQNDLRLYDPGKIESIFL